jgi:hypothetical protein
LNVGSFSYWFDKPWFHNEGRLAVVLIIPSSWGSQLGGHLHAITVVLIIPSSWDSQLGDHLHAIKAHEGTYTLACPSSLGSVPWIIPWSHRALKPIIIIEKLKPGRERKQNTKVTTTKSNFLSIIGILYMNE